MVVPVMQTHCSQIRWVLVKNYILSCEDQKEETEDFPYEEDPGKIMGLNCFSCLYLRTGNLLSLVGNICRMKILYIIIFLM